MSRSRKTNRDHAKKTQRPMVEDEIIASQLEAVGVASHHLPRGILPPTGIERPDSQLAVDGGGGLNPTVARCGRSERIDQNVSQRGVFVVFAHSGKSAGHFSKILNFSRRII